jgi:4-hydroxy-tetrahydrodipicolinate reductase
VNDRRYRVVQWATGNIGMRALREVIRHPRLDLAGVLVYDDAKNGVDAGVLCGETPVGIAATTDRAAMYALDVDCVLYMPRMFDVNDVVAFLESGTNVVTTRGELFDGGSALPDEARARVEDACRRGNTSAYATGSSPGFITDALPFALLSMQRHVDAIEIDEFADLSRRDSAHLLFEQMGYGRAPESFSPNRSSYLLHEFGPALKVLAEVAGRPVDTWSCTGAVATARARTAIVAGVIEAGTVAAQRTTITGTSGGDAVLRFSTNWYCTTDVDPAWELQPTGWRVRVHGDAPFDVALPFPIPLEELGSFTPAYTANRPVNAVPYVCAAAPGILSPTDLPPLLPAGPRA